MTMTMDNDLANFSRHIIIDNVLIFVLAISINMIAIVVIIVIVVIVVTVTGYKTDHRAVLAFYGPVHLRRYWSVPVHLRRLLVRYQSALVRIY